MKIVDNTKKIEPTKKVPFSHLNCGVLVKFPYSDNLYMKVSCQNFLNLNPGDNSCLVVNLDGGTSHRVGNDDTDYILYNGVLNIEKQ